MGKKTQPRGHEYRPHVKGKHLFRVSEQYLATHVVPLVKSRRANAAKLDLILRGIAMSPDHAGEREPGLVLRKQQPVDYPAMHDLVRDPHRFSSARPEDRIDTPEERDKKREWIREQLVQLEKRKLLERIDLGDGRVQIKMLSDLGDGTPFDDPGAAETRRSYITIHGPVLADLRYRDWGSPELVGYLCAMVADRHATTERKDVPLPVAGARTWYRQADWFNNKNGYRPEGHIILPFSSTTIERGLKRMRQLGYVDGKRTVLSPGGKRLNHPRMIYTNRFNELGQGAAIIDINSRRQTA